MQVNGMILIPICGAPLVCGQDQVLHMLYIVSLAYSCQDWYDYTVLQIRKQRLG